jgi:hypothetical protein
MSTIIIIDPNVPQADGTGAANLENEPNTKVAKFMGHMLGKKEIPSSFETSLHNRSVTSTKPQSTESQSASAAPSSGGTAPASLDLEELANAIETGKSQIGIGTKFLAWIKSWFGGDSFDTAIAKQAFSKIEKPDPFGTGLWSYLRAGGHRESTKYARKCTSCAKIQYVRPNHTFLFPLFLKPGPHVLLRSVEHQRGGGSSPLPVDD